VQYSPHSLHYVVNKSIIRGFWSQNYLHQVKNHFCHSLEFTQRWTHNYTQRRNYLIILVHALVGWKVVSLKINIYWLCYCSYSCHGSDYRFTVTLTNNLLCTVILIVSSCMPYGLITRHVYWVLWWSADTGSSSSDSDWLLELATVMPSLIHSMVVTSKSVEHMIDTVSLMVSGSQQSLVEDLQEEGGMWIS